MNGTFLARFDKDGNILSTQGYQGQNEQVVGKVIQMFNDVVADGEATFKKAQGFKDELFDVWAVVNNFPQVVEVLKSKGLTAGYLLTFDFRKGKNRKPGSEWVEWDGTRIFDVMV